MIERHPAMERAVFAGSVFAIASALASVRLVTMTAAPASASALAIAGPR
jgi:hypothetical protein